MLIYVTRCGVQVRIELSLCIGHGEHLVLVRLKSARTKELNGAPCTHEVEESVFLHAELGAALVVDVLKRCGHRCQGTIQSIVAVPSWTSPILWRTWE